MKRRFFAKEVVQTSNMDCGVASLKSILDSFGIASNYEKLRDTCKTDVNGTSIDRLEEVLCEIGFDAYQMIVPTEQLSHGDDSLYPAIAVVNIGNNIAHFVVIWRKVGRYLQIVDPAQGRYWIRADKFAHSHPYIYSDHMDQSNWLGCFAQWQREEFLAHQCTRLGINPELFTRSTQDIQSNWQTGAKADAILRFIAQLTEQESRFKGQMAEKLFQELFAQLNQSDPDNWFDIIPSHLWTIRPVQPWYADALVEQDETPQDNLFFCGALILKLSPTEAISERREPSDTTTDNLAQALATSNVSPFASIWSFIKTAGTISPTVILLSALLVSITTTAQAVAFKMLFEFDNLLAPGPLRAQIAIVVFFIVAGIAVVNVPLQLSVQKLSRRLEDQFRIALYEKLPKLKDSYFTSRLLSDLIERSHAVAAIEDIPALVVEFIQALCVVLLVFAGLIYLAPELALWLSLFVVVCLLMPLIAQHFVAQKDLNTRTLSGTLTRHYANALLGLFTVKVHSGEATVLSEQQQSLTRWARAADAQRKTTLAFSFAQDILTYGFAAVIIAMSVNQNTLVAPNILMVYWLLLLPGKAEALFVVVQQTPMVRNIILRLQEPLSASEDPIEQAQQLSTEPKQPEAATSITFKQASFSVAGEVALKQIDLEIRAGEHIAIVGTSGAGKSTLLSSLLGFAQLEQGELLIDGSPHSPAKIAQLRQQSAWLDPQVYLFKRSIIDNISYGSGHTGHLGEVLDEADLWPLIEGQPDSIHSDCGEAGSLLSGGEGQRVRLARALNKPNVTLALLDEPFRGLDKSTRVQLMTTVRKKWQSMTLVCVIHDVEEAKQFDRVVVLDDGAIVQQGSPQQLLSQGGAFKQLLEQETQVAQDWLGSGRWRRIKVANGNINQASGDHLGTAVEVER